MPKVIVYVPAAAWRRLEERGLDPAKAVREFAKRGYETSEESITSAAGFLTPQGREAAQKEWGKKDSELLPAPMTAPRGVDDHFKPDFGRKLK